MNKRIKSLIERAEYQAKKQSGYEDWEVYVPPDPQVVFEKFAELIVGECIRKINDIAESSNNPQPIYRVAVDLLEHFGVEE
jgi:hypothetical protein